VVAAAGLAGGGGGVGVPAAGGSPVAVAGGCGASAAVGETHPDVVRRAAGFLLLGDSRASFQIEGEEPSRERADHWARAIGAAGSVAPTIEELDRLQRILIPDSRFVELGVRREGGFVGIHDRATGEPIPEHINARAKDLDDLLAGVVAYEQRASDVLRSHSRQLLDLIEWRPTLSGNVEVLNETADYYRYFDATPHTEFLYRCVRETVEQDLPNEVAYLKGYDRFSRDVQAIVDLPERTVGLLLRFLELGGGKLSQRAREREFAKLEEGERELIEELFAACF